MKNRASLPSARDAKNLSQPNTFYTNAQILNGREDSKTPPWLLKIIWQIYTTNYEYHVVIMILMSMRLEHKNKKEERRKSEAFVGTLSVRNENCCRWREYSLPLIVASWGKENLVDRWKIGWPDRIDWTSSRGAGSLAPSLCQLWRTRGNKLLSIVAIIRRCSATESLPVILGRSIKTQYTGSRVRAISAVRNSSRLIENELFSAWTNPVILEEFCLRR